MRRFKKVFIACIISFCWGKALAEIIRVPQDQPNIQSAINAASSGDTVLVSPGVYRENIDFMGKDVVVGSLLLTTGNKDYISTTVIEADSGTVVTFARGETQKAILGGFTITGGSGTGIRRYAAIEVFGAGLLIRGASPVIKKNLITRNSTWPSCFGRGGGIAIMDSANPLIVSNAITADSALGPCLHTDYPGGGIWVDATSNPIIGGNINDANNIYANRAEFGQQIWREGRGKIINAQFNYWGRCPPSRDDVDPQGQFDTSNCLDKPVSVGHLNVQHPPTSFQLLQNYPNPFNAATTIEFHLPYSSQVSLEIFNLHGEKVATLLERKKFMAGAHKINWQAEGLATGLYFYHLRTTNFVETRKLILLK